MKICAFLLLCCLSRVALGEVQHELSGNVEGQFRHSKNNSEAKEDLFQDWDQENFHLFYGNLNAKLEQGNSRIEANWFLRYSQSDLYDPPATVFGERDPYFATNIFTFPNRLVARDLFKLQHIKQESDHKTESILNKFFYEYQLERHRFMIGRMYINYGQGEIFNPVNPFNQPTGLTAIAQVAQGNDGISYTYFLSDTHSLQFLLLGDKSIHNYQGEIDTTFWLHGDYQPTDKLQMNYVLGEDQNRHKLGGQLSYNFEAVMAFVQLLYQSQTTNNKPSNNLWDAVLGLDQQVTNKWHIRFEGGYQKQNRFLELGSLGERFLPTEYFVALANIYELHPLFKVSGTLINDVKSGFTYLIAKGSYDLGHSLEAEVFGFTPVSQGDDADNMAQKLVTTDVGLALRAFF